MVWRVDLFVGGESARHAPERRARPRRRMGAGRAVFGTLHRVGSPNSRSGPGRWFFDAWARIYDLPPVQRVTYIPVHDTVARMATDGSGALRILDVGCGTGILAARLAASDTAVEVVGCDFSGGMLRQATQRTRRATWTQADAQDLPFPGGVFDLVVCTESFHWYPDQDRALREFRRVLVPGGRLLLALVNTRTRWAGDVSRFGFALARVPLSWPTREGLRTMVEKAGFDVVDQERVLRFPPGILFPTVLTAATRR